MVVSHHPGAPAIRRVKRCHRLENITSNEVFWSVAAALGARISENSLGDRTDAATKGAPQVRAGTRGVLAVGRAAASADGPPFPNPSLCLAKGEVTGRVSSGRGFV